MVELQPPSLDAIAAFYDALGPRRKRIVACAPDCYERVRDQIENGPAAELFDVQENDLLVGGQVFVIDPAALFPPWDQPFEPLRHRCAACLMTLYEPGLCLLCREFEKLRPPPKPSPIINLGLLL
jgi:hypothetical protein